MNFVSKLSLKYRPTDKNFENRGFSIYFRELFRILLNFMLKISSFIISGLLKISSFIISIKSDFFVYLM